MIGDAFKVKCFFEACAKLQGIQRISNYRRESQHSKTLQVFMDLLDGLDTPHAPPDTRSDGFPKDRSRPYRRPMRHRRKQDSNMKVKPLSVGQVYSALCKGYHEAHD